MRQRITHGAVIDAATPQEVAMMIAQAFDQQRADDQRVEAGSIVLDSTGAGKIRINVHGQYDWDLRRITCVSGPGALVVFYENDENSASNMLEVVGLGSVGMYSDGFSNHIQLSGGSKLIIVCTGGVANGSCSFNLRGTLLRRKQPS